MRGKHGRWWLSRAAGLLSLLAVGEIPAAAQCALCYTSAAASGAKGIHALQIGILILLVPALTMLAGILFFAFRYRNGEFFQGERVEKKPAWENDWMALPLFPETEGASSSG